MCIRCSKSNSKPKNPIQCRFLVLRSHIVLYLIPLLFYFMCGRRVVLSARFSSPHARNPYIQTQHITYTQSSTAQYSTVKYNKLSRFDIRSVFLILFDILIILYSNHQHTEPKGTHEFYAILSVFYFIRMSIWNRWHRLLFHLE